jgi:hypothetical protein
VNAKAEEEPVITASVSYPKDACSTFVVPDALDAYGPAPEPSELAGWARKRGGATANNFGAGGTAMILLTVTGHDQRPVTITDLTFSTTVHKDAPMAGTTVGNDCGDQTVAPATPRWIWTRARRRSPAPPPWRRRGAT